MAYCVHCGVELDKDITACPLCGTPVPETPDTPTQGDRVWPDREDHPHARLKKRSLALFTALMLLIPIGICLYSDYKTNGVLTWSLIVCGAVVLTFVILFSPFVFKRERPLLCVLIDGACMILFMLLISVATGGDWLIPIGLPLAGAAFILALILTLIFGKVRHMGFFAKMGSVLIACGLYAVFAEWILSLYLGTVNFPGWSVYVSIPSVLAGLMSFVLNASPAMKERLKRRFFI